MSNTNIQSRISDLHEESYKIRTFSNLSGAELEARLAGIYTEIQVLEQLS